MDSRCHIGLLDGLRVFLQDGRRITRFQTRQTAVLLAYMALYRDRSHLREVLMGIGWPEDTGYTDRHKLRVALNSLRRQLEPPGVPASAVIVADRNTIRLNPAAVMTDVGEFEAALEAAAGTSGTQRAQHLAKAVGLYQGELLPGNFDAWILPERQRLAEAYFQAIGRLIGCLEESGDLERAIEYARRGVAADPLREELHHELIRLLAAAGQPDCALQQYQELERLLEADLGTAPDAATRTLVQQISRGGPVGQTLKTRAPRTISPARTTISAPPPLNTPSPLPTGTVTFLLIEVESAGAPEGGVDSVRSLCRGHGGHELQATGEMLRWAFGRASDALAAAAAAMRVMPFLCIALHTGEVEPGAEAQRAEALQHGVRLLRAAHPGQILTSEVSAGLLRADLPPELCLAELGLYRLQDGASPERLFQARGAGSSADQWPPPKALPAHQGLLPLQITRFFGREAEIARLCELLGVRVEGWALGVGPAAGPDTHPSPNPPSLIPNPRLVTLTGAGGSGKTRLALELAERLRDSFHGAVWFVPLADLSDPRLVPDKLREVLGLPRLPNAEPLEQVVEFLSSAGSAGPRSSLVVVDNFEQLTPGGVGLPRTLLQRVKSLTLLVTSRQRLDLAGEREFPVAPLPAPPDGVQVFRCSGRQSQRRACL